MSDAAPTPPARLLGLTARIVSAHASHNPVATNQLPELIKAVHRALGALGQGGAPTPAEAPRPGPAVPIRRSVRPDRIVCLECGAEMKTLKRHLATEHDLTPETYRERWNLGRDYPMVAPDYAEVRSGLARQIGLGRKRGGAAEDAAPEEGASAAEAPARSSAPETATPAKEADEPAAAKRRGRRRAKGADAG